MSAKAFSTYLSELAAASAAAAGNIVPILQSSVVKGLDGADIGGGGSVTTVTQAITGTDPANVVLQADLITDGVFFIQALVVLRCTVQGGGTCVVGESYVDTIVSPCVSNGIVNDGGMWGLNNDASMSDTDFQLTVSSGDLVLAVTPPSTAAADSEFEFTAKIFQSLTVV